MAKRLGVGMPFVVHAFKLEEGEKLEVLATMKGSSTAMLCLIVSRP